MALFKQKYRIESVRLPGWDYAAAGWYFVTICTRERQCFFGDVVNGKVYLSAIGEIVAEEWQKTEEVRSGVKLDEWIIMPNHLHGIIVIEYAQSRQPYKGTQLRSVVETRHQGSDETPHRGVSSTRGSKWKPNSLGAMVGQFKSVCTKRIWAAGFHDFAWQPRFYDHIIRDERSLHDIQEYIINNPLKWELDKDKPENLYM